MVAFLAALPAVFAAIKSATDLFDVGKQVVEEIQGGNSTIQTPAELKTEVEALPPDQKARFVERMRSEIDAYEAITGRIGLQSGQVNSSTLEAIPVQKRGQIALLRMSTRPWAVRWMVIAVVFPPLALVTANLSISFYNVANAVWFLSPAALPHIHSGQVMNELYLTMVGWASGIIMTYMGMREFGKAHGHNDSVKVSDITGSFSGFLGRMKKVF